MIFIKLNYATSFVLNFVDNGVISRLQSMAFSTRSRWCGAVLAGADNGYSGAVRCEFGVVRCR